MSAQRRVVVYDWLCPVVETASLFVWPVGAGSDRHPEMLERVTVAISTGCAQLHVRMTVAEVQQLIDTLQWALAPQPEPVPA